MKYIVDTYSSKGGRSYNEDSLLAREVPGGLLCIVADGLGMHGGGDAASKATVDTLAQCLLTDFTPDSTAIGRYLELANTAVLGMQTVTCKMKSTVAALICRGTSALIAHVGDSRCYYFKNGAIAFQTIDHSVSQMAVTRGEIQPEQIRFHEDRNRLLRAIGGSKLVRSDMESLDSISEGDAFLLCTDGFWEYINEYEMEMDLLKSDTPSHWLSYMLSRIGKRVNGKNDNLTAVAVFCKGE